MPKPKTNWTEDQKHCLAALAHWCGGYHHLPAPQPFGEGVAINWSGDLATWDWTRLTMLVLTGHAFAVRIEIASSGPRMVKIIAHRRSHGERQALGTTVWHPSLRDLQAEIVKAEGWTLAGMEVPPHL